MSFSPASLLAQLMRYPAPSGYLVAYSGGCDSHVLLHALAAVREQLPVPNVEVIHINHGLQSEAPQWQAHCKNVCNRLDLPYRSVAVEARAQSGESPEAAARAARYTAFSEHLGERQMLLLAHHQDDQAETLLLQLLRGSGVKGLAAMPEVTHFAGGWLARPLLFYTHEMLCDYARQQQLQWIEDPSNFDTELDRNFLRHEVFPKLQERWPSASVLLSRASEHQAEAAALLNELAALDWQQVEGTSPNQIRLTALARLSVARQRNLVRYWIGERCGLPLPDSRHLERIFAEVIGAGEDAEPLVSWAGVNVRRFRDVLVVESAVPPVDNRWRSLWDCEGTLALPGGTDYLEARDKSGAGLARRYVATGVEVAFRQGGERVQLPGREHRHQLKKLLQDWGVPPWERDRIPLIYIKGELAQVVGYCVCAPFAAVADEPGVDIVLHRH
jgi:tRNA(Ile)-lysidine synthase